MTISDQIQRLAERAADGDRAAVDSLVETLWPLVRKFCAARLSNADDADDATQNAVIKLFQQIGSFDAERSALGWAFAIARFECMSIARNKHRHATEAIDAAAHGVAEENPLRAAELREIAEILAPWWHQLSDAERDAIVRGAFDDAPSDPKQAAATRQRRHRALLAVRTWWRKAYGQQD